MGRADHGAIAFAYLPVNVAFFIGPAIGSVVTEQSVFAVFPAAAVVTALGVGALAFAYQIGRAMPINELEERARMEV